MLKEPIRKRGYYRALKRKEPWAVMKQCMTSMMNDFARSLYSDALKEHPLLKLI